MGRFDLWAIARVSHLWNVIGRGTRPNSVSIRPADRVIGVLQMVARSTANLVFPCKFVQ